MTDYSALKVPDLKALLGQRKLHQTGNKQALIARLQEDDEKNIPESTEAKPEVKEDEITYSDDEATASKSALSKPAPTAPQTKLALASEAKETAAEPVVDKTVETTEPAVPAQSYAMGLEATGADKEARKRAERAKRFGIDEDNEAKQRSERAKRFGLDQSELASSLDSALPERPLKRGRGRGRGGDGDGDGDGDRNHVGKRQNMDRKGRHGRDPRQRDRKERHGGGGGVLNDAAEKAKAQKRAARFATS